MKHLDFILLDMICAQIAFILAYSLRHGLDRLAYSVDIYRRMAIWIGIINLLLIVMFNTMRNVLKRSWLIEIRQTLFQSLLLFGTIIVFTFSVHEAEEYSRITLWVFLGLYCVLSFTTRMAWKQWVGRHRPDREKRSMLIVAEESIVPEIIQQLNSHPYERILLRGLILTDRDAVGETIDGVSVVADLESAAKYICQEWIDEVFFVLTENGAKPHNLIDKCNEMGVTSHLFMTAIKSENCGYEEIAGIPVLTYYADRKMRRRIR